MRNFLSLLLIVGFTALSMSGCDRAQKPLMVSMTETPTADDPEAFTVALVHAAVEFYKANGSEATAAHYNDPASIDGYWYVFITDPNDIFLAHPTFPSFIGTDLKAIFSLYGSPIGTEITNTTDAGNWTEYLSPNPETNKIEQKYT